MIKFAAGNYIEGNKKIKILTEILFDPMELRPVIAVNSYFQDGIVNEATLDIENLRKILHEWKLMKTAGRPVEVEILDLFSSSSERTLAVAEIKDRVKRKEASIHRALNNLVKKKLLTKPGRGTYRRNF